MKVIQDKSLQILTKDKLTLEGRNEKSRKTQIMRFKSQKQVDILDQMIFL